MQPHEYAEFTARLLDNLRSDPEVLGLVALGSMARQAYPPDEWSDHDFFVVVRPGRQERWRARLDWLPDYRAVAFSFRETEHGLKVLYENGHLLEFAVFDPDELGLAKVNRYRVLLDRADLETRLAAIKTATVALSRDEVQDDARLFGQFICNLLVGVGRYRRGERLSAGQFVRQLALRHLLVLLAKHLPSDRSEMLDNLDPFRRFEQVYPELGCELDTSLSLDTPQTALQLLRLARRELVSRLPDFPDKAIEIIERQLLEQTS